MSLGHLSVKISRFNQLFFDAVMFWQKIYDNPRPALIDWSKVLINLSFAGTSPLVLVSGSLLIGRVENDKIVCKSPVEFTDYFDQLRIAALNEDFERFWESFESLLEEAALYVQKNNSL